MMNLVMMDKVIALFMQKKYDEAIEWLHRSSAALPNSFVSQFFLVSALLETGHEIEARDKLKDYLSRPNAAIKTLSQWQALRDGGAIYYLSKPTASRVSEGLRSAGMTE
jgi:predicted Zn-dependent protease